MMPIPDPKRLARLDQAAKDLDRANVAVNVLRACNDSYPKYTDVVQPALAAAIKTIVAYLQPIQSNDQDSPPPRAFNPFDHASDQAGNFIPPDQWADQVKAAEAGVRHPLPRP